VAHAEDAGVRPMEEGKAQAKRKHLLKQGRGILRDDSSYMEVDGWATVDIWRRLSPNGQDYVFVGSRPREAE
jgi:hypothetical protein